ncbi:MAG: hypothetical protein WBN18_12525 [Flavobacteriaceae bacterium]
MSMDFQQLIDWLLQGDVAIQYQVHRDLLSDDRQDLRNRIANEGWGAQFLSKRRSDGHWGLKFYQPKWTSTHYTLLDLRNLCISPEQRSVKDTIQQIIETEKGPDGGINPSPNILQSDVCLNGMFLNYACYFQVPEYQLLSIIDFILDQHMQDGGFNCRSNRSGAVHSSLHTSLSVLEGFLEYGNNGYKYRLGDVQKAAIAAEEFVLMHQLFRSDKTGKTIDEKFLRLSYPRRWRYDILSALDYFQAANTTWDQRMQPAMDVLLKKRKKDGSWKLQAKHPGQVHFEMEKAGRPSRWNTLRALRVLSHYKMEGAIG